jgi:hypothetical protein
MKSRFGLALMAATLSLAAAPGRAADPITFQPEVLLMKTASRGTEKSFTYAKLKPAIPEGKNSEAVFRYRADTDTVTVSIKTTGPDTSGTVTATVFTQRKRTLADGHDDTTNKTGVYKFTPGKSLIVDSQPRMLANEIDANVEILQLTLVK